MITSADISVLDALDFPAELQPMQDAYWKARREWKELEAAYLKVALHMLSIRAEHPPGAERTE